MRCISTILGLLGLTVIINAAAVPSPFEKILLGRQCTFQAGDTVNISDFACSSDTACDLAVSRENFVVDGATVSAATLYSKFYNFNSCWIMCFFSYMGIWLIMAFDV